VSKTGNLSRFKIVEADVDQLQEHYAKTLKPVRVGALNRGTSISVEDTHFSTGDFDIWSGICRSGMEVNFSEAPDAFAIYLPLTGAMELHANGHQFVSTPGKLIATDLSQTHMLRMHSERSHIGIAFSRKAVIRQLSELLEMPVTHDLDLFAECDVKTPAGAKLAAFGQLLWSDLSSGPAENISARSTEYFFRTIMVAMLENLPHRYSALLERPASPAMPRQVKRAIDFMVANITNPITVEDISQAAGVGVRALQVAFQQFKETTPLNYLRRLRLESVHRELIATRHDRASISDIARKWGFTHMGRFSLLYREAFGEMPTETLQLKRLGK
jgi:AraC-like DNA-binding protein